MKLVAENLVVDRGGRTILDDLSLTAVAGEALILTGPNGAGKTTLLRTLAGFLPQVSGRIRLEGGDAEKIIAEQAHVVGHGNAVKANLTARENLQFWAAFLETEASAARVKTALTHFGLDALDDYPAAYLSAGQKRRLGLARLLVAERPLWFLDEPTMSLDTASTKWLAVAIDAHTANGGLVIAATHLPLGLARARTFDLPGSRTRSAEARS
ncbi:MAG: heme ABC exporter ATP-binding protein CcmA [Hyphomicrobium sp.]|nr:heme ABC exporter ATP-binding protein CcmA [Hyphomicrobium sp.]